jgi:hypothetical protein
MALQNWNGMTILAMRADMDDDARILLGRREHNQRTVDDAGECLAEAFETLTEAKRDAEEIWAEEARLGL